MIFLFVVYFFSFFFFTFSSLFSWSPRFNLFQFLIINSQPFFKPIKFFKLFSSLMIFLFSLLKFSLVSLVSISLYFKSFFQSNIVLDLQFATLFQRYQILLSLCSYPLILFLFIRLFSLASLLSVSSL